MSTYIRAIVAAMAIEEKYGIPLGDLVDTFADIPAADVVPVVRCQDCVYARPLKDMNYDYLCRYQAWRKAPAFRHGDTAALKEY